MTTKELAEYLGKSVVTIYKKTSNNQIPYTKMGRKIIRFRKKGLEGLSFSLFKTHHCK